MKKKIVSIINAYSFLIIGLLLISFELIHILKGEWTGDFWEHSAVVKELSRQLLHPGNPIIKSDTPHAFFSPYSLLVAIFSRATGLSSIHALACFGFLNLLFFLFSFHRFCKSVFEENSNLIATICLFLILFFHGKEPFMWSGFYHVLVLHYVLPYPSTFAISLSFLILSMVAQGKAYSGYLNRTIVVILSSIVFITHPTTAIFLYVGIIALNFTFHDNSVKRWITMSSLVILPSLFLSSLWPYYSVMALLIGNGDNFHEDSKALYQGILQKNWPATLALPAIFLWKDKVVRFFGLAIILMVLALSLGYVLKVYGLSRLISNVVMFAYFLIAYLMSRPFKERATYSNVYSITLGVTILISLYINRYHLLYTFNIFRNTSTAYYDKYNFLKYKVAPDDVVLSDADSNFILTSFNGKVISSIRPLYWVEDMNLRREAVASFFNSDTSDSQRQLIIQRFRPDYILIDYTRVDLKSSSIAWLRQIGQSVYRQNQLELIKLK